MTTSKQASPPISSQQEAVYKDEISLIDIYLTIKRNSKLFFSVIIISFLISLVITYFKQQPQSQISNVSSNVEHVLILEIGRIYGVNARQSYIDQPKNTLEKIRNIYIPKLNQTAITAEHINKTDLIIIKLMQTSDKVNYNEVLLTLADYIIKDHNQVINLKNKYSIKPTKIIQLPIKRIVGSNATSTSKSKILIPILGLILGILLGFFAIVVVGFLQKVKKAESEINLT